MFLSLIALAALSTSSPATFVRQGEITIYEVRSVPLVSSSTLKVLFHGVPLPVFKRDYINLVVIPADVDEKSGEYELQISDEFNVFEKSKISVKQNIFKKIIEGVAYEFVTLPATEQQNIQKAKAPLVASLNSSAKSLLPQLWSDTFDYPVLDPEITEEFGRARIYTNFRSVHKGVDFRGNANTPIFATSDGKVSFAATKPLYFEGNSVILDHGQGIVSEYLHLSKVSVKEGEFVKRGDVLGYAGDTGFATGPHLHFAIKIGKAYVDPVQLIESFGASYIR